MVLGAILLVTGCAGQKAQTDEPASKKEKAQAAVEQAEKAVKETRRKTDDWGLWKSVLGQLANAKKSLESEDYEAAIEAADTAKSQAEMGLQQYNEQQQVWKKAIDEAKNSNEIDFPEQQWVAGAAGAGEAYQRKGAATGSKQLKEADGTLVMGAAKGQNDLYKVARGDTLWDISSSDAVYGNPFAWPLIYKANRDDIHDPDLIYPDQELTILRNVKRSEVDRAVEHARTRGAWSLGEPEASDLEYLDQAQ
jgi:nucleoid-associated protein YgaU